MNRMLDFLRGRLAGPPDATDRHLLDRFLADRDQPAFAEVVRRHGPLVWGVCRRRLANTHDAEDAFQAAFLVLVRRAASLPPDVPLGPWLHRVAVMTTRNLSRGNRRRAAVSGPMERDVPSPLPTESGFDIDAALLALPERERAAVVLCHLQGLTRKEAAAKLGCPEGTLSARLSRALGRLRFKFGAATAVPIGLTAATVRAATISVTSSLTAAGVCPVVAGLTNGVLHMFWVKKLVAAAAFVALLGGGLMAGFASDPAAGTPVANPLAGQSDDPAAEAKRIAEKIAQLQMQQAELERALKEAEERDAVRKRAKLLEAAREKLAAKAQKNAADLKVIVIGDEQAVWEHRYRLEEQTPDGPVTYGTSTTAGLTKLLARAKADPTGPKSVTVVADQDVPNQEVMKVFAACARAGFTKATFSMSPPPADAAQAKLLAQWLEQRGGEGSGPKSTPVEIDLGPQATDAAPWRKW